MAHWNTFKLYLEKINGFRIAVLLLLVSGAEDTVLTAKNIGTYGLDIEGNPILRQLVKYWGVVSWLALSQSSSLYSHRLYRPCNE